MSRGWLKEMLFFTSERSLSLMLGFLLLLLFVVYPFVDVQGMSRVVIEVFFSMVLISGTFAMERRVRRFAFALLGLSLLLRWAAYLAPSRELLLANAFVSGLFVVFACAVILSRVFAPGPVTTYRIQGAITVYLLIGLVFGMLYTAMVLLEPTAFELEASLPDDPRSAYDQVSGRMTYFSFITLTTVGYGDITPQGPIAKQFAVLEGLIGQLYPAILLARLVSMELSSRQDP